MNSILIDGPRLDPASGNAPDALIILLHGYGSNGADMISLAPHWRQALPGAVFVAPNGPERCPGMAGGYQWWGLADFSPQSLAAGTQRAAPVLDHFIDTQLAGYGVSADRLLLVGFSQGTMMALYVGPRREHKIAGIIGYSGMLADVTGLPNWVRTKPPVLLVHGTEDPIVPLGAFHDARRELQRLGFDVADHVSGGLGHGVDQQGLELGRRFARKVLASDT